MFLLQPSRRLCSLCSPPPAYLRPGSAALASTKLHAGQALHSDSQALTICKNPQQLAQLFLHDAKLHHFQPLRSHQILSSSSSSASSHSSFFFPSYPRYPPGHPIASPVASFDNPDAVCSNPASFPPTQPTSIPLTTMALAADTKRVVDQFEFTDADVNNHVQEFLKQMSMFTYPLALCRFASIARVAC